jgi:hypothetical protein
VSNVRIIIVDFNAPIPELVAKAIHKKIANADIVCVSDF